MEDTNNRTGLLPEGCKDLIDVLKQQSQQQSVQALAASFSHAPKFRVNGHITADRVRLVDLAGKIDSVLPLAEAIRLAHDQGLDVVEIDPSKSPPVCLMVEYGRFHWLITVVTTHMLQQMKGAV